MQKSFRKYILPGIIAFSLAALTLLTVFWIIPVVRYSNAEKLLREGKYLEAADIFAALGNYSDSADRIPACKYAYAEALIDQKKQREALQVFKDLGDYSDTKLRSMYLNGACETISAGNSQTLGLKNDGTIAYTGFNNSVQADVSGWTDVIAVSSGFDQNVALKSDGTVEAIGTYEYGHCNVDDWTDIIAISAGNKHTLGLKADGTVVFTPYPTGNLYPYEKEYLDSQRELAD